MTKGELIVACLKLMFEVDDSKIDASIISTNEDYNSQYGSKINNMIESINRAFMEVQKNDKMPKDVIILDRLENTTNNIIEYEIPYDVYKIINIKYDSGSYVLPNVPIRRKGNKHLILNAQTEGKYIIEYYPRIELLTEDMDDNYIINMPDEILQIIPYFVKGDLYEEDEPNLAIASRNMFSSYLAEINRYEPNQTKVFSTFKLTDF